MKLLSKLFNAMSTVDYDKMKADLLETAASLGVEVEYSDTIRFTSIEISGTISGKLTRQRIHLRTGLTTMEEVMQIAHELGHSCQFKTFTQSNVLAWLMFKENMCIMMIEQDAWIRSVPMLHEIGFKEWKFFRQAAIRMFASYVHISLEEDDARRARVVEFARLLDEEVANVQKEVIHA